MEENIKALNEISKGADMGIESISVLIEKVEDHDFYTVLDKEKDKYEAIADSIRELYKKYKNDDEPQEAGTMAKAMTWSGIEMKTLMDKSQSKIAELLINGTNMGIVEGRKILNNKHLDKDVKNIVSKFVAMQEESLETLKKYL